MQERVQVQVQVDNNTESMELSSVGTAHCSLGDSEDDAHGFADACVWKRIHEGLEWRQDLCVYCSFEG